MAEQTKKSKARARAANRNILSAQQATEANVLKIPTYKSRLNRILDFIQEQTAGKIPAYEAHKHPPAETALLFRQYQIATRDNMEAPTFRCHNPECRHEFMLPALADCPACGTECEYQVPNVAMEANTIKAAHKLLDKLFPNLNHNDNTVNFQGAVVSISGEIARIIVQHVPADRRRQCLDEIDALFQKVQGAFDAADSAR